MKYGASNDTIATLTENSDDVLVSTLRITVSSDAPSGFVRCSGTNLIEKQLNFTVIDKVTSTSVPETTTGGGTSSIEGKQLITKNARHVDL